MDLKPVQLSPDEELPPLDPLCAVFRRHLKAVGQKYTPERAHILDTLIRMDDLFEAEQLQQQLKREGRRISKATVYRTIKLLEDAGILQKILYEADQAHFQLTYGRRPREILVRLDTKQVISIEIPELAAIRERVCREHGLRAASHRFMIYATGL
ncbi:MAG: transcriptional repressor [Planctomycetota bacterium]|nr:transcriptional repressor [Planctomycetota bacterium]